MNDRDRYIADAARRHGVNADDVLLHCRSKRVCIARYEVMRRLRHDGLSLTAIGRELGRDHTTILHGLQVAAPGLWFG